MIDGHISEDGILKLFWGESKIYGNPTDAIRDCLASIAPFLIEPEHEDAKREEDLILLSDKADLNDPTLTEALRLYFDRDSKQSKRVQYCGIALIGFDANYYPSEGNKGVTDEIATAAREGLKNIKKNIGNRLKEEKLDQIEIEMLCRWHDR